MPQPTAPHRPAWDDQPGRVPPAILYAASGVSDRAVRLYAILTAERREGESLTPGHVEMAGWLGCSPDTIQRALAELEGAGVIEVRKRRDGRRQATNEYVLGSDQAGGW